MGALASRQNAGVEEADVVSNHAYKYPPRSGNYFGSHFIMGGERFDTPQPEAYLFGENADLNFLGSRPTHFPYPPPQSNEPTKTLKSLVNIRKESLRFVRCTDAVNKLSEQGDGDGFSKGCPFNIEFTFDCDARCSITIYYFCTEEITPNGVVYYTRDPSMNSHSYRYKRGANQQFSQASHVFDPTRYLEEDLLYNAEKEIIPIAIHCVVEEGTEEVRQSHTTIAVIEKHSDGTYVLKALKQKLFVDGLCYLLQEIYGIENKNNDNKASSDEETEDNGSECVICMCDVRDTLILPCRHLCLCNSCADSLRYQANNCPICRAPFRALLQIRALQKVSGPAQALPASPPDGSMENIPAGYEPVSLIEALNGPCPTRPHVPSTPQPPHMMAASNNPTIASPDGDSAAQAAEILNRSNLERNSSSSLGGSIKKHVKMSPKDIEGKTPRDRALAQANTPEFRMSVLLAREEDSKIAGGKMAASSPLLVNHRQGKIVANDKNKKHHVNAEAEYEVDDLEVDGLDGEVDCEPDSEAEKLSPLLTNEISNLAIKANGTAVTGRSTPTSTPHLTTAHTDPLAARLHLEAVLEPIDDTDTDEPEQLSSASGVPPCPNENEPAILAEDSDYFTPEDTTTTILTVPKNPVKTEVVSNNIVNNSSTESTPQRWPLPHHVTSLPGTPLSHISNRSSGDSYSSSSSTRHLLGTGSSILASNNLHNNTASTVATHNAN